MPELGVIIQDAAFRVGLSSGQIDVTGLTENIEGYLVASQGPARQHLQPLLEAFDLTPVDDGDVIRFKPVASGAVSNVNLSELLPLNAANQPLERIRRQRVELPYQVAVRYPDRDGDYQVSGQTAIRSRHTSQEVQTVEVPIVLTTKQAGDMAVRKLNRMHAEGDAFSFKLPIRYADILSEDIINLTNDLPVEDGALGLLGVRSIVVKEVTFEGLAITVTGFSFDAEALDVDGTYDDLNYPPNIITQRSNSIAILLDIPSLRADDVQQVGVYAGLAVADPTKLWDGGSLYSSLDGTSYDQFGSFDLPLTNGVVDTAIGDGPYHIIDESTVIEVVLSDGELSSITDSQFHNAANLALVGKEILSFKTATLIAPLTYQLTYLRRGMLGTEAEIASHGEYEFFALLEPDSLAFVPHPGGAVRYYKALTNSQALSSVEAVEFTADAVNRRPLAPANPLLSIAADGSEDLQISFERRVRGYIQWGQADLPLNDGDSVRYEVDILSGNSIRRTLSASVEAIIYPKELQISDFGEETPLPLAVRLYQTSPVFGRGTPCDVQLDVLGDY